MTRGRCVIAVIACIAATALASPAAAQTNTAEIAGVVKDATGGVLAGAGVVASQQQEITVPVGSRVTFVNGDRISHEIASGLDHNSLECREIDVVGFLSAGQRRDTATFDQAKTCRLHDVNNVGRAAYQGRIVIQ